MEKECTQCHIVKPLEDFAKIYSKRKDGSLRGNGRRANCRKCENKRRQKSYQKNPITGMLSNTKTRCKKKGIEFNITIEDVPIPLYCPILLVPLNRGLKGNYNYSPTIDRIDPNKGYIKGNVKVISMLANRMKSNATEQEIRLFIQNILNYLNDDIVQTVEKNNLQNLGIKSPKDNIIT